MNRKRIIALLMATAMSVLLTACGEEPERAPSGNVESSVSAIEDAMITKNDSIDREDREDFRDGTSEDTVATPTIFQTNMILAAVKFRIIPETIC